MRNPLSLLGVFHVVSAFFIPAHLSPRCARCRALPASMVAIPRSNQQPSLPALRTREAQEALDAALEVLLQKEAAAIREAEDALQLAANFKATQATLDSRLFYAQQAFEAAQQDEKQKAARLSVITPALAAADAAVKRSFFGNRAQLKQLQQDSLDCTHALQAATELTAQRRSELADARSKAVSRLPLTEMKFREADALAALAADASTAADEAYFEATATERVHRDMRADAINVANAGLVLGAAVGAASVDLLQMFVPALGIGREESKDESERRKRRTQQQRDVARVMKIDPADHLALLKLDEGADIEAVRQSFRELAGRLHPDVAFVKGSDEAFRRLVTAFTALSGGQWAAQEAASDLIGKKSYYEFIPPVK